MLCQNCQQRTANVHFTKIVNNNKVELFLCEQCAKEKGQSSFESAISINDFLSGLIGLGIPSSHVAAPTLQTHQAVCSKCGMSYEEFQKTGRLGCSQCYEMYGKRLEPILRNLHGTIEHHGKMPVKAFESTKTTREIETLRRELEAAIKNEEYEKAAELRDKIKNLEQ